VGEGGNTTRAGGASYRNVWGYAAVVQDVKAVHHTAEVHPDEEGQGGVQEVRARLSVCRTRHERVINRGKGSGSVRCRRVRYKTVKGRWGAVVHVNGQRMEARLFVGGMPGNLHQNYEQARTKMVNKKRVGVGASTTKGSTVGTW